MFLPKLSESQIHKALLSFQLYQKVCNSLLENFHGTITHHSDHGHGPIFRTQDRIMDGARGQMPLQ